MLWRDRTSGRMPYPFLTAPLLLLAIIKLAVLTFALASIS